MSRLSDTPLVGLESGEVVLLERDALPRQLGNHRVDIIDEPGGNGLLGTSRERAGIEEETGRSRSVHDPTDRVLHLGAEPSVPS